MEAKKKTVCIILRIAGCFGLERLFKDHLVAPIPLQLTGKIHQATLNDESEVVLLTRELIQTGLLQK